MSILAFLLLGIIGTILGLMVLMCVVAALAIPVTAAALFLLNIPRMVSRRRNATAPADIL